MSKDSAIPAESGGDEHSIVVKSDRLSRANDWISLAANIGVLIGLIALIVEIDQYRSATRLQIEVEASREKSSVYITTINPQLAEALLTASLDPEGLTDLQKMILDGYYASALQRSVQLFSMYREGIITEETLKADLAGEMPFVLGSPFGLAWWWESEREGWYGPSRDYLDEAIKKIDPNFNKRRFERIDNAVATQDRAIVRHHPNL